MTRRTKIDNDRARYSQKRATKKQNAPIPFTFDQLSHYADTPFFYDMILYYGWLDCVYGGDPVYNDKLMFIRRWWKERVPDIKLVKNGQTHNFALQLSLF